MKTYKIKNYKGNLVESLKRFSDSHKGMKIVEACEDGDDLKIKAEESTEMKSIEEAVGNKVYVLMFDNNEASLPTAICSSIENAKKIIKKYKDELDDTSFGGASFEIIEYDVDKWDLNDNHWSSIEKI